MKKIMKSMSDNLLLFLGFLSLALAVDTRNTSNMQFFLLCSVYQFGAWALMKDCQYYLRLWLMQLEVCTVQMECIAELAMLLIPYIGKDRVLAILERYGIEIKDIFKNYNDKNRPWWKKKRELQDWVKEAKEKIESLMQEPEMVGAQARMQEH